MFQVLLSSEDLLMMIDEASGGTCNCSNGSGKRAGSHGTVNLGTFLKIMDNAAW